MIARKFILSAALVPCCSKEMELQFKRSRFTSRRVRLERERGELRARVKRNRGALERGKREEGGKKRERKK